MLLSNIYGREKRKLFTFIDPFAHIVALQGTEMLQSKIILSIMAHMTFLSYLDHHTMIKYCELVTYAFLFIIKIFFIQILYVPQF